MERDTVRVETIDGPMWVFRADQFVSRSLALYGEYAVAEVEVFRQLVRPGHTVVEAGANIGSHSVFLARACAPSPFFAFEPQQRVFQVLCANLTINAVTNARVFPDALGAEAGVVEMALPDYRAGGNVGGATLLAEPRPMTGGAARVRVSTLDAFELPACDFLKIDVEGFEVNVLKGAEQTVRAHRPVIYTENDRKAQQAALIDLLAGLDYRLYWHVAPLFRPGNHNGKAENIFGNVVALNMLCIPKEKTISISGFEEIDPANWTSPVVL